MRNVETLNLSDAILRGEVAAPSGFQRWRALCEADLAETRNLVRPIQKAALRAQLKGIYQKPPRAESPDLKRKMRAIKLYTVLLFAAIAFLFAFPLRNSLLVENLRQLAAPAIEPVHSVPEEMQDALHSFQANEHKLAISQFSHLLQAHPELEDLSLYYRGLAFIENGESLKALHDFRRIHPASPYYQGAEWQSALLLIKFNNRTEARQLLQRMAASAEHPHRLAAQQALKRL